MQNLSRKRDFLFKLYFSNFQANNVGLSDTANIVKSGIDALDDDEPIDLTDFFIDAPIATELPVTTEPAEIRYV